LRGHLWGGRFQVALIEKPQVTGGNGRNPQTEKHIYIIDLAGFALGDKFRIIEADSDWQ
jgi:hypothetical protein